MGHLFCFPFLLWRLLLDSTTNAYTIAISREFHTYSCRNAVERVGCMRIDESRSMTSYPQPLQAVEPDEWAMKVRATPFPETLTQRQRDVHDLTHSKCPACVSAADDPHRRRQDARDSGVDVASFDHCDISAEVGMFNKKLKFKVLVSHRSGAVAALDGPKDVTEHMVRFVCDMLETWSFGVCPQVSERAGRDGSAERCCQDKAIQDDSEKHARVLTWQFGSL